MSTITLTLHGAQAEITREPRHWNKNAACFIPECWVVYITFREGDTIKVMGGTTQAEALETVAREFPELLVTS
tara:strand:+ start:2064 stop:2282 length:219 start_codon:yes stop_codon:yes gene_type:complete